MSRAPGAQPCARSLKEPKRPRPEGAEDSRAGPRVLRKLHGAVGSKVPLGLRDRGGDVALGPKALGHGHRV